MANEKRLIDANLLVRDINADPYRTESEKSYDRCLVFRQPTVDAVEVVRCRDCFANGCCSVQNELGMGGEGYCPKGRKDQSEFEAVAEIWNGYAGRERKDND